MPVVAVGKRDQQAGVGNSLHVRENPFRAERSFGPRTLPARRIERTPGAACASLFELLAHDLTLRSAAGRGRAFQPFGEPSRKTNCQGMTHMA